MPTDQTIREKVQEFIKAKKMFTSVDISNAIKKDGLVWVRNREVTDWLHRNINDVNLFGDYANTLIFVDNGRKQATLYYPMFDDPNDYVNTDEAAITPDEFKAIQKSKIGQPTKNAAPDITSILDPSSKSDTLDSAVIVSTERIKIPGHMIRKLGWNPGDTIDPAVIKTHRVIPGRLKVNSDYRVSIPRSAVNWGTSAVKVILKKDNTIVFDKA